MPRWKKDEVNFPVSVIHLEHRNIVNVPKPIIDYLGDPDILTFHIEKNGKVTVSDS